MLALLQEQHLRMVQGRLERAADHDEGPCEHGTRASSSCSSRTRGSCLAGCATVVSARWSKALPLYVLPVEAETFGDGGCVAGCACARTQWQDEQSRAAANPCRGADWLVMPCNSHSLSVAHHASNSKVGDAYGRPRCWRVTGCGSRPAPPLLRPCWSPAVAGGYRDRHNAPAYPGAQCS